MGEYRGHKDNRKKTSAPEEVKRVRLPREGEIIGLVKLMEFIKIENSKAGVAKVLVVTVHWEFIKQQCLFLSVYERQNN